MVLGCHTIFCSYGFWLPNNPRGTQSTAVLANHLQPFEPATKLNTRISIASTPHGIKIRRVAHESLKYPPIEFTDEQIAAIARGIQSVIQTCHVRLWACAILPEQVHLAYARHRMPCEEIIGRMKMAAGRELSLQQIHPMDPWRNLLTGQAPSPWANDEWTVSLNSPDAIERSVEFVRCTPVKFGRSPQQWTFVVPYPRPV